MKTLKELNELAAATDFRPEALEKIHKLLSILERLDDNELSHGQWVLKGGTALNLFHLEVPRLSVDIDINFLGAANVEELQQAREVFERVLNAVCERSGCSIRRAPFEHAGGKFRLRYSTLLGGEQNLEVDVSYVARVPLWSVERRGCLLRELASVKIPSLTLPELAAGKFTALLARSAPRDTFDALNLIEHQPSLFEQPEFRVSFVTQIASSRADLRQPELPASLNEKHVETQLVPLLRVRAGAESRGASITEALQSKVRPVVEKMIRWSEDESRFLDRLLDDGELEPEHVADDLEIQERISRQPMLLWKQKHVRQHKGLDPPGRPN